MSYPKYSNYNTLSQHDKALLLLITCQLLYIFPSTNEKWKRRIGLDHYVVTTDAYQSVEYMYFTSDSHQFLFINGTDMKKGWVESIKDLLVSAKILPKKGRDGNWYHWGYHQVSTSILRRLESSGVLVNDLPLVISGHSMGGAIAKIIANETSLTTYEVFSFGAPQTVIRTPCDGIDTSNRFHYVRDGDFVPSFPSTIYYDYVPIFEIQDEGRVNIREVKRRGLFISVVRRMFDVITKRDQGIFYPHAITNYIRHLMKASRKERKY